MGLFYAQTISESGLIESVYVSAELTPTPSSFTEPVPVNVQVAPSGSFTFQDSEPSSPFSVVNCAFSYKNLNAKLSP